MAVAACSISELFNVVEDIGGVVCLHRIFSDDVAEYVSNTDSRRTRTEQRFPSKPRFDPYFSSTCDFKFKLKRKTYFT